MCGIVALVGGHADRGPAILDAQRHRGPDADGAVALDGCTLAMTRLAVQDLDPRSNQPMAFAGTTLVFNGEIYNHRELRAELEHRGHRLTTTGDTEVLLHALVEWGVDDVCTRLEGMFAFAAWDQQARQLHLARDPFGIKPLYWFGDERGLAAASEATPLAEAFALGPAPAALREFLRFGSPARTNAYERLAELEPGTILTWQARRLRGRPYRAPTRAEPVDASVRRSVVGHLRSDRPVVLFLSGGFDSALLASIAASSGAPIPALTLVTRENALDAQRAQETARHYGLGHELVSVEESDVAAAVEGYLDVIDQPTIDGFNTYLVARAAIDRGFPVALSGLGGDEVLGGYGYTRRARQVRLARGVWQAFPPGLRPWLTTAVARRIAQPPRRLEAILGARTAAATWSAWRTVFDADEVARLTGSPFDAGVPSVTEPELTDARQFRALDFSVYLRTTLLRDSDVSSMANSVEMRVPLLDERFVRAADGDGTTKLRLARALGDRFLVRRARQQKLAFSMPWRSWIPLLDPAVHDVWDQHAPLAGVIDVSEARRLLERDPESSPIRGLRHWALVVLARWLARDPAARRPTPRPV